MTLLFCRRIQQAVRRSLFHNKHLHSTARRRFESSGSKPHDAAVPPAPKRIRTIPGPSWAWIDPRPIFRRPLNGYSAMQARSPYLTQLESALLIYYLGDLSAQIMDTNVFVDGEYEPVRALRAMLIGGLACIPSYRWYIFLGKNFNYPSLGHWGSVGVKVMMSQMIFTPLFNSYFFGMHSWLAGGSLHDVKRRICDTVPSSWYNSFKVWPAVTAFSFTFIKPQNRNVFAGVVAIFWQTYLLWLNKQAGTAEKAEDALDKKLAKHSSKP
ncbi:Hypothetical protein R9X50_00290700 [Acrodontium crateriforme]|uniref:Uncharacterized protein n=1 Tax=Acrodontium crateriforme TaxID=150365 RepID=A0AAQ3M2H9_9PEZI|nr:Hypothetical protein R9X50_00290700 [Acrodontium crateriforme]